MSKSTVRTIHSSMLLHSSGKVNRAVLLPSLKILSLLPHKHFEIFPCGLQPLSLTGSLLLVSVTVTGHSRQQHFQTGYFITAYLVIQRYFTSVVATSLNTGQVLLQPYVCSPHTWTGSSSNTYRQLNIEFKLNLNK